jgi:3-hydroxyacyl-CoA dehydrogenase
MLQCIPENFNMKRKLLVDLDTSAPNNTIIASNSSSYSISELLKGLPMTDASRMISAHCCEYFNVSEEVGARS